MTIEHKDIPNANLHEPKGVSTAADNTTYVADGLGSGAWKRNLRTDHGTILITNNAIATAVTAAADATLNTDSDYVKITAGWAASHETGVTLNTDSLLVSYTGDYYLQFWGDFLVPATNNFIGIKYGINNTPPYSLQKLKSQSTTANDYKNLSGSSMVTLTAGDYINVYLAASKTDNIVVEEAGMSLILVH
jgi:hypothetical protein